MILSDFITIITFFCNNILCNILNTYNRIISLNYCIYYIIFQIFQVRGLVLKEEVNWHSSYLIHLLLCSTKKNILCVQLRLISIYCWKHFTENWKKSSNWNQHAQKQERTENYVSPYSWNICLGVINIILIVGVKCLVEHICNTDIAQSPVDVTPFIFYEF